MLVSRNSATPELRQHKQQQIKMWNYCDKSAQIYIQNSAQQFLLPFHPEFAVYFALSKMLTVSRNLLDFLPLLYILNAGYPTRRK
jgi:hypothetical protein